MIRNTAIGASWEDVERTIFTPDEIAKSNLRVAIISELIKARKKKGVSQRKLGKMSGVRQPVIARMEEGKSMPRIDTLIKILAPLGKTLAVVPMDGDSPTNLSRTGSFDINITTKQPI